MANVERVFVDARAKPYVSPNNRDVVYFDVWDETRDPPVIIRKTAMTVAALYLLRADIDACLREIERERAEAVIAMLPTGKKKAVKG